MLSEAKLNEPINRLSCFKPYKLTKGCGKFSKANIDVVIEGRKLSFASNDQGNILHISKPFFRDLSSGLLDGLTLDIIDTKTDSLNNDVLKLIDFLNTKNIKTLKIVANVHRVFASTSVYGYVLELDGNGFEILNTHIIE